MATYVDLLIVDNDLELDEQGEPVLIVDLDCIAQDVSHLIRDSGVMLQVLGERSRIKVAGLLHRLKLLIEADARLVPGSVKIQTEDSEIYIISATAYQFGAFDLEVVA